MGEREERKSQRTCREEEIKVYGFGRKWKQKQMKVGDGRKRRNNIRNNVKNIESKGTYM